MGGKKGNRTKGNTRPSSSGRTAELLSASGVTGFVGFTGLATDVPASLSTSSTDDVEASVDGDFRMVMKKITKRDSVTKVKALQEFSELCQSKDELDVKGALPYWPRLFVKLAVDHDRRVRETTHQANKHMTMKVKKDLAPYLKSIMGTWVISMCDSYAPASSAAQEAFRTAFPAGKQPEALDYCRQEIVHFITEILFQPKEKVLGEANTSSPEETDAKYIGLISSSLRGLRFLITHLHNTKRDEIAEQLTEILEDNKFWKYANHKETEVRTAWYFFISSFCQLMPELASKYVAKLAPLTLGRIEETQTVLVSLIWEATLHLLTKVGGCWQHVNAQKSVFPQLWRTLRSGGNGNADQVFHNLLPFLSQIPPEVCGNKLAFYSEFFKNFKEGLLNSKVQSSPIGLKAVIQAFFECLKYILLQHIHLGLECTEIRQVLVEEHLCPVIELAILDVNCHFQRALFTDLGRFLHSFELQINLEENVEISEALNSILHHFWTKFSMLFKEVLAGDDDNECLIRLKRFAQFFGCLNGLEVSPRPKKVSFARESETKEFKPRLYKGKDHTTRHIMVNYTHIMCKSVLNKIKTNPRAHHLELLYEMVCTVPSKHLFADLASNYFDTEVAEDHEKGVEKFVENVILDWLQNRDQLFGGTDCVSCIIGLLLAACACIPKEKALVYLNQQCQKQDYIVLEVLISQLTSNTSEMTDLCTWLKGWELGESMVLLASKILGPETAYIENSNADPSWKLLKVCFTANENFDTLIGGEYLNQILSTFNSALVKPVTMESSVSTINFVCDLAQSLFMNCLGCYQLTAVENLLLCLFELSCYNKTLSSDLQNLIKETWCLGIEQLLKIQNVALREDGFLCKAAQSIQDGIMKQQYTFSQLNNTHVLEDNAVCLLKMVSKEQLKENEASYFTKSSLVRAIIDRIFPTDEAFLEMQVALSQEVSYPCSNNIKFPKVQIATTNDMRVPPLLLFVKLLSKLFRQFLPHIFLLESPETNTTSDMELESKEFVTKHLPTVYVAMTYGQTVFVHPQFDKQSEVSDLFAEISGTASTLQKHIDPDVILHIFENFVVRGILNGKLFLQVLPTVLPTLKKEEEVFRSWITQELMSLISQGNIDECQYALALLLIPCAAQQAVQKVFDHVVSSFKENEDVNIGLCTQNLAILCTCVQAYEQLNDCAASLNRVLKYLMNVKLNSGDKFICEKLLASDDRLEIEFVIMITKFCSIFLSCITDPLEIQILDFMLCTLCGWISTLHKSGQVLMENSLFMHFAQNVFHMLSVLKMYVTSPETQNHAPDLITEWKELYFPNIYSLVFPIFFQLCGNTNKFNSKSWETQELFNAVSKSLDNLPPAELLTCISNITPNSEIQQDIPDLCKRLYFLLISDTPAIQWCANAFLTALMPKLSDISSENVLKESDVDHEECTQRELPVPVAQTLSSCGQVVDAMLAEFHVGDCCLVKPYTDSYTYTLSYLLSWLHVLIIFSCSNSEVRSEYASKIQNSNLLYNLLLNLFRLMPVNPTLGEKSTMFSCCLYPQKASSASSQQIQKVACHVYLRALSQLPALIRQWWNNQDKRTADYVNKYTTTYVSSLISLAEIKSVQETNAQFNNMIVKARPTAREVVARYTMEDITIELVIKLPPNHPLGPVSIEVGQRIGVGITQWRHWMLQLTTFLTHQNGSILDALSLWKRNVDKRFEGVEECMICFYVLHGATCQLPRLTCKTCKKKFHSACLYKWFSTSQNASCPLCRNLF